MNTKMNEQLDKIPLHAISVQVKMTRLHNFYSSTHHNQPQPTQQPNTTINNLSTHKNSPPTNTITHHSPIPHKQSNQPTNAPIIHRQTAAHNEHLSEALKTQKHQLQLEFELKLNAHVQEEKRQFQKEVALWITRMKAVEEAIESEWGWPVMAFGGDLRWLVAICEHQNHF